MNETLNYIVHHNLLIALLLFLTNGKYIYAQIGIGTTSPHESAALELKSNTKGFLPPLLSSEERNAINDGNPAEGLVIFNTDTHCLEWSTGTAWYNLCTHSISTIEDPNHDQPPAGSQFGREFLNGFEDNPYCSSSFISVASCRLVWGAGINDDPTTPNGIEYDWADATDTFGFGIGAPTTNRAIVEIGGQCWAKFNTNVAPAHGNAYCYENDNLNCKSNGKLYDWAAVMEASQNEGDAGICPWGWHVPSDCEWMYLEHNLGMSVEEQQNTEWRGTLIDENIKKQGSTGFDALLSGFKTSDGTFKTKDTAGYFWTSTQIDNTTAYQRSLSTNSNGIQRTHENKTNAYSVRCLFN